MSYLQELYQEVILDHNKRPRNCGKLDCATCQANGYNPLCGDKITIYLQIDHDRVKECKFEGNGCAISTASASLMTEIIKGKTIEEVKTLFERFHDLVTGQEELDELKAGLGKLQALAGVREFPMRVKCATLAWHTLNAALKDEQTPITTE
ncbi:MAG TPA: SUF system NifU family Fe-S cluster assembly protein [bacterium]|nr:SUF system NifU family Fe-S cluster assembly protein [bacterium]